MIKSKEFQSRAKSRIVIQTRAETINSYGGAAVTWTTLSTVWAYMEPYRGVESDSQGALKSTVYTKILIRYIAALKNTAVTTKYRITFDGRIFPITSIKNLDEDLTSEGKRFQEIVCQENNAENPS